MEKKIDNLSPIKRFWKLLKKDKKEIRYVYLYAIFNGFVNLSLPIGIQAIINLIQGGSVSTAWVVLVTFVILGIIFSGLLQISQLKITEILQQKLFARAAFEFAFRIPNIKMAALYKHYAPELMNRFFDIISVQKGISKILIDFSSASIQVVFGLILLSLYHPFFIIFSLILVILVWAIFQYTAKVGLETSLIESKNKYHVAHWLQELARTNVSFKLAGKTSLPLEVTDKRTESYINARESHFKILVKQYSLLVVFKAIVASGLLVIGSLLVMEQQMNIGQFVAAEIIILLVINSVEKLIVSLETIYDVLTSLEKIGQVTDLELENNEGICILDNLEDNGLKLELNKVSFGYTSDNLSVLSNINVVINPNEKVLLYGDNDSGKSTLMYLMSALYAPSAGFIAYNDLPQGNLKLSTLRNVIGDCLREELLFDGTIYDNIKMGREKATFENIKWAIHNIGLEENIKRLPKGYDTMIDSRGQKFSKGIIDKILLARAIADKPRLLLIKDAFGAISPDERNRIINFLTHKDRCWTLVLASSNEALAPKMEKIIILKEGKIEKIGSYNSVKDSL
ncbi:MAG: ATP-binding cassette domain-containing protein [Wenyingzhuangia sp.]|jgi:ABC-type bacteriocin/lantibiotic exporter with double-glycine peptidase domain|uniref:peptidase domain-containing ABC transporter n=1 Tax=Wenyingzhuangia sp. TaxID=1964193 RepID=UPI0032190EF9